MTDKLDRIPEEIRARLAAVLLKSIGAGPIQAPGESEDDDVRIVSAGMEDMGGLLAFMDRAQPQRRAATALEVDGLNRKLVPPIKVGDKVRWKPGYRMGAWPDEGEAVIVSQLIDPPIRDTRDMDGTDVAARNDIALAFADESGDTPRIFEFVFDSRRFERVED